ncbi:MAG: helicase-related protein [Candidatus Woesearchaeota archaeon]
MSEISEITDNSTINIVLDTFKKNKQALVFCNTRKCAEATAEKIAKEIKNIEKNLELEYNNLSEVALNALSVPTKQCHRLSLCLKKGVAFHHAGLVSEQRSLIENNFRKGIIKVICATPTLAYGLNLPAFRAIIKDLKRYGNYGMDWIPTLEYHQMAGRAGRPDFNDKFGEAICIANNEKEVEEILDRFINAPAEKIYSKLAVEPVLRTYCLSLLATGYCKTKQDLINFFEKTFYGKQYGDIEKLGKIIDKILNYLDEWQFIELPESEKYFNKTKKEKTQKNDLKIKEVDFLSANEIYKNNNFKNNDEKDKIIITKIGQRVSELYIDPYTANTIINALNIANNKINNKKETNENSFIQLVSTTLELRPLPTVRVSEIDEIEKNIEDFPFLIEKPDYFDAEYDDFLRAMKLTFALIDWMNEKTEDDILNKYNISPGELNAKKELADWVLYSTEELCHLLGFMDLLKIIKKTRYRLEKGIKEELIPLTRLTGIGRIRARLLFKNGIKDIGDIKKTDLTALSQLLGKKIAENLKNETGEIKEPVYENKRKGQLGLGKYY